MSFGPVPTPGGKDRGGRSANEQRIMNALPNVVLFDTPDNFENLLPLSYTRPVADFRVGIVTIKEKWQAMLPASIHILR